MAEKSRDMFDSQDDIINDTADQLQLIELAEDVLRHKGFVHLTPKNIGEQPGLLHEGQVVDFYQQNQRYFIQLRSCKVQGKILDKTMVFPIDQIQTLTRTVDLPPIDSSQSFVVIDDSNQSMNSTQPDLKVFRHLQPHKEDPKHSTPHLWADMLDNSDMENLSPIPAQKITSPGIPIQITQKRKLPILADGQTLDKEYLEKLWQLEDPSLTFEEWCNKMQITNQMQEKNLKFGHSIQKSKLEKTDPTEAVKLHDAWERSFNNHYLPFDDWYKPNIANTMKKHNKLTQNKFVDLTDIYQQADLFLEKIPSHQLTEYRHLHKAWSTTLIRKHNLTFPEWLKSPLQDQELRQIQEKCKSMDLDIYQPPELLAFANLLMVDETAITNDYHNLHDFIVEDQANGLLRQKQTFPTQAQFLPHSNLSHIYVPQYNYVPYSVMHNMQLKDIQSHKPARHVIWSRLKATQQSAYNNSRPEFDSFANTDEYDHVSPFIRMYSRQQELKLEPPITSPQVTQQIMAHHHLRTIGGLACMSSHEFYDLFIRPFEYLVTRGMPLHQQLLNATYNLEDRYNLFRNIINLAGFSLGEQLPSNVQAVYQELTRVRHLNPYDLTEDQFNVTCPFQRLDPLPTSTEIHLEKSIIPIISKDDFKEGGKLQDYYPQKFAPLPGHILDKFPELSGRRMSIVDHHRLLQAILSVKYPSDSTPIPAARKKDNLNPIKSGQRKNSKNGSNQSLNKSTTTGRTASTTATTSTPTTTTTETEPSKNTSKSENLEMWSKIDQYTKQQWQIYQTRPDLLSSDQMAKNLLDFHKQLITEALENDRREKESKIFSMFPQPPTPATYAPAEAWRYENTITTPALANMPTMSTMVQPQQAPFSSPQSKFANQPVHMLQSLAEPNVELLKPQWMLKPKEADKVERIFPGDFLWPGDSMHHVPESTKFRHSAASISRHMEKTIGMYQAGRYQSFPNMRTLPIDGIFNAHTCKVSFDKDSTHEQINFQVTKVPYATLHRKFDFDSTEIKFPAYIFHRFTRALEEVSEVPLPPRNMDPHTDLELFLTRLYGMSDFTVTVEIKLVRRQNQSERMTIVRIQNQKDPHRYPTQEVHLPWFQMYEVATACKDMYAELYEHGFI